MISFLYIGSIVPDESFYVNNAFSRAGNMCQIALLKGLVKGGMISSSDILSLRPAVSFPRSNKVFYRATSMVLDDSICLKFLPFINITPIKQFSIGLAALYSVLKWGWRTRHAPHRVVYTFNITAPPDFSRYWVRGSPDLSALL